VLAFVEEHAEFDETLAQIIVDLLKKLLEFFGRAYITWPLVVWVQFLKICLGQLLSELPQQHNVVLQKVERKHEHFVACEHVLQLQEQIYIFLQKVNPVLLPPQQFLLLRVVLAPHVTATHLLRHILLTLRGRDLLDQMDVALILHIDHLNPLAVN
jgi:hypothetical protein